MYLPYSPHCSSWIINQKSIVSTHLEQFCYINILEIILTQKTLRIVRESIPRQTDKKSRVPKKEKGVWGSRSGDAAASAAKSLQSCSTLCNPIGGGPPGSPKVGIGVWNSQGGEKDKLLFPSIFLAAAARSLQSCSAPLSLGFSIVLVNYTTQFKLY